MKTNTIPLCFFIFLSWESMCCQGCSKQERDALFTLNSRFLGNYDLWGEKSPESDCCQWERVECNNTTGRVAQLRLDFLFRSEQYTTTLNYSDFVVFKDLKSLSLFDNNIVGCAGNEGLENLEVLDLSFNHMMNADGLLSCVDGLSSLKSLYLMYISFNTSSFHGVFETLSSKLRNLEVLDMSENYLTNDILPSLEGFTSLKELYLSYIQLDSDLHIEALCSSLKNLEVLDLSGNNFNDTNIAYALGGLSSLKSLDLASCQLTLKSIFISSLETLDLSRNNLNENFLLRLEVLDLSGNNFNDTNIAYALRGLSSLKSLYLGYSQLTFRSIFNISKLSSLETLDLSWNNLNESIPLRLENDGFTWPAGLQVLELQGNSLTNKFVSSLNGLERLKSLYLGRNQLEGSLDITGLTTLISLEVLDLSFNNISDFVVHQGSKRLPRLDVLYLGSNMIDENKLRKSLQALSSVRELSMWENNFKGTIVAQDFHDLSNLEQLILDRSSNLENEFFKSIGELTSLKVLSLSGCNINGTLPPADWSKLKKLEELDLSENEFMGPLPSSFVNMSSLVHLDISDNYFNGDFDSNIASLASLEYFGFEKNQFEVLASFTPFANHSKIKSIYGGENKVILDSPLSLSTWIPKFQLEVLSVSSTTKSNSLSLPNFLLYQNSLTNLDFSNWKLEGEFPLWLLENNTKMTEILFRDCSITGTFRLPLRPLSNLRRFDVSGNTINGQIPGNISSIYPNLHFLNLSRNNFQGSIPSELGQMNSLYELDLSDNHLFGKIPQNIFGEGHQLYFLKLSNNKFEGPILTIPYGLETLLLNNNSFTGRLPGNILNTSIISLDVSNNHLVGKIPSLMKNLSRLRELYLSNNHFEGSIPLELGELKDLSYLDLSQNNFTGLVPSFANSSVTFIHLNNNHLSGLSNKMFNGDSSLVMLDLSYNEISNNLQDLIKNLSDKRLNFLILKGNHFTGDIPKELCQLINLNILDLSHNNFSGVIPNCLGKMPFENKNPKELLEIFSGFDLDHFGDGAAPGPQLPNVQEKANFTSKERTYTYMASILVYMSAIDLSHNKLKGNIPSELGNLTRIRALNLSHNDLTGQIPATFSHLIQTESLDLSFNMLNGQIPPQLSMLTFLAYFSVAYNNLSGSTPEFKGQFSTFDERSYEGNEFLCGPPLSKSCNPPPSIIPNDSDTDGDNDRSVNMYVFCVSFGVSYISTLLVIAASLYINPYWRQAWFYYMELVSMNCYYFIQDNLSKIFKIGNM